MEEEIKDFWQLNPCGAELVGDFSDETREAYEDFFKRYDDYRYTKEAHILANLDRIDFKGKRVLEIGLGQGADAEQIIRRGGIYSGVDLTAEAAKRTETRFRLKNLDYETVKQGSVLALPFEDDYFDIVFSHGVLHHVPDIKQAQKEIHRVLKPSGELIVMFYAKWSLNYLAAISVVRRLGLLGIYASGANVSGIYSQHLKNAKKLGVWNYLKMSNFIHTNTDGPLNPYSKVYDVNEVKKDFADFEVIKSHKHFMHAPPLKVNWLKLENLLGWHLWVHLKPTKR